MADIIVNDLTPRVQYTATGGQTVFPYTFPIFVDSDLKVYQTLVGATPNDATDILTLTTEYTVSGAGTTAGGNVTLVTGATAGDIITIVQDMPIDRTTDYVTAGSFLATTQNDELDAQALMLRRLEAILSRALRLSDTNSSTTDMRLNLSNAGELIRINTAGDGVETVAASILGDLVLTTAFTETLLDDADAATARTTLDAQQADALLTAIAALVTAADQMIYSTGSDTVAMTSLTAFARTILDDADAASVRTTISAQQLDATLTALAAVVTAANKLIYATGSDTFATTDFTAWARTLLDDADAATALTTLGITDADTRIARAWVSFNGTGTIAKNDSYNVGTLGDNGTGYYTINFTSSLADANYCPLVTVWNTSDGGSTDAHAAARGHQGGHVKGSVAPTTSAFRVETYYASTGTADGGLYDYSGVYVAVL